MKTDVNIKFGKRITELREKKKLSQEELAFRANIHRAYIGTIERGEKSPTLNTIEKIAKALDVEIFEILKFN